MRFVQFKSEGTVKLGVASEDGSIIKDITSMYSNSMIKFIESNPNMEEFKNVVGAIKTTIPAAKVEILPPVTNPQKILCIALNYKGHCDEQNKPYPKEPVFFSKYASTLVGEF